MERKANIHNKKSQQLRITVSGLLPVSSRAFSFLIIVRFGLARFEHVLYRSDGGRQ